MLIKDKIKNRDHFTSSENLIAEYLCDHSQEVLDMSLDELSNALYVSKSTIIRFCKKLGFCGHKELCVQLAKEINTFCIGDSSDGVVRLIEKTDTSSEIAQKIYSLCYHAITTVYNQLDLKALMEAADIISMHGRIRVFSTGKDYPTAMKLVSVLAYSGIDATLETASDSQKIDASVMNLHTAAVLICSGTDVGYLQKTAEILQERMIPVILITGAKMTVLNNYATVRLVAPVQDESAGVVPGSWVGLVMLCEILCTMVFQKDYDTNARNVMRIHEIMKNDK